MAVLIDTDVLIAWERAGGQLDSVLDDEEQLAISVITVSELLHGVHRAQGAVRARRLAFAEHVLDRVPAITIGAAVARVHAAAWAELAGRGQTVGARDLWIAATALSHDMALATGNAREMERVSGLRVLPVTT